MTTFEMGIEQEPEGMNAREPEPSELDGAALFERIATHGLAIRITEASDDCFDKVIQVQDALQDSDRLKDVSVDVTPDPENPGGAIANFRLRSQD